MGKTYASHPPKEVTDVVQKAGIIREEFRLTCD